MRRTKHTFLNALIFSGLALGATSCGTAFFHANRTHEARIGEPTARTASLSELPEPRDPVIVAVYQFRDQTGQYKPQEGGSGFSTAVTQGAANILVKVLQDSKWFVPIERENISDLLNERKIIRSTRQQFGMNEELPALLYAGVLLEGGIVSYDANVVTGGAGLRYFGTGGGSQYRQDRVTVYLRAISVSNGKILKTVYASKMILSQSVDGGMFRFVKFQRLLEAETGYTFNEPSEMAVTEAIERAVQSLVYEGIAEGLWELKEGARKKEISEAWMAEKKAAEQVDVLSQITDDRRRTASFSLGAANFLYKGDFARPRWRPGAEIGVGWNPKPSLGWLLRVGASELATEKGFETSISCLDLDFQWRYTPFYRFTPNVQAGLGVVQPGASGQRALTTHFGAGMEWLAGKNVGLRAGFDFNYAFSDQLDGREAGRYNDTFWRANAGVNFYFGKKVKNKKPIQPAQAVPPKPKLLQGF